MLTARDDWGALSETVAMRHGVQCLDCPGSPFASGEADARGKAGGVADLPCVHAVLNDATFR